MSVHNVSGDKKEFPQIQKKHSVPIPIHSSDTKMQGSAKRSLPASNPPPFPFNRQAFSFDLKAFEKQRSQLSQVTLHPQQLSIKALNEPKEQTREQTLTQASMQKTPFTLSTFQKQKTDTDRFNQSMSRSLEKKVRNFIEKAILSSSDYDISVSRLESIMESLCKENSYQAIKGKSSTSLDQTLMDEFKEKLKDNGAFIRPLILRLIVLRNSVIDYIKEKELYTDFVEDLLMILDNLISTKNITNFHETLQAVKKNNNNRLERIIQRAFCEKKSERKKIFKYLSDLKNPAQIKTLDPKLRDWYQAVAQYSAITKVSYNWDCPHTQPFGFRDVNWGDVVRCLVNDDNGVQILPKKICLNHESIYDSTSFFSPFLSKEQFLHYLFSRLFEAGLTEGKISAYTILSDVEFVALTCKQKMSDLKKTLTKNLLPCLQSVKVFLPELKRFCMGMRLSEKEANAFLTDELFRKFFQEQNDQEYAEERKNYQSELLFNDIFSILQYRGIGLEKIEDLISHLSNRISASKEAAGKNLKQTIESCIERKKHQLLITKQDLESLTTHMCMPLIEESTRGWFDHLSDIEKVAGETVEKTKATLQKSLNPTKLKIYLKEELANMGIIANERLSFALDKTLDMHHRKDRVEGSLTLRIATYIINKIVTQKHWKKQNLNAKSLKTLIPQEVNHLLEFLDYKQKFLTDKILPLVEEELFLRKKKKSHTLSLTWNRLTLLLDVLRLCTNVTWKKADELLKEIPGKWKYQSGIELSIHVWPNSSRLFDVCMRRKLILTEKDQLQFVLPCSVRVAPLKDGWKGSFRIREPKFPRISSQAPAKLVAKWNAIKSLMSWVQKLPQSGQSSK